MSLFFSRNFSTLTPYVPGEQPLKEQDYIKLNTNESPYPPSNLVTEQVLKVTSKLHLYNDPECSFLKEELAKYFGIQPHNILPGNGSDEILYLAFMAFCDENHPIAFPDISYGFYSVFAAVNRIPFHKIPLKSDFSIDYQDYLNLNENIVIANPNAPTGLTLSTAQIEKIVQTNPNHVVIIDEAYVDFGGESCVPLIQTYKNLLITQTFSKSRSMAGARLGIGIADSDLITDLNTLKNSINPYNVNSMTQAAGIATLQADAYYKKNCQTIIKTREFTFTQLQNLGFLVLPSKTNFLFVKKPGISGQTLYQSFKQKGILVRYFPGERTSDYVRISIGTIDQMQTLIDVAAQL